MLSERVLEGLGVSSAEARRTVGLFRDYDERRLVETHAFYKDERQLIQSSKQTADELTELLESDRTRRLSPGTLEPQAQA